MSNIFQTEHPTPTPSRSLSESSAYIERPSTTRSQSPDQIDPVSSQPRIIPRSSNHRRAATTDYKDLFWDIVGRDNYTTSLNYSEVLCSAPTPTTKDYSNTAFAKKFSSFPWRLKRSSPRIIPTMTSNANASPISLLTTTVKSRSSTSESPTITSTLFGDWEDQYSPVSTNTPITPPPDIPDFFVEDKMPPVQLSGRKPDTDPVLDADVAEQVRQQLPRRLRMESSWTLLYSIDQHGTSMTTMYTKVKDKGPMVLAIKDENNQVFGAFVTEAFKPHPSYYGTGECYLWKCIYRRGEKSPTVRFYLWTGRNQYLVSSEHDYLGIGGGDGRVGLWINSNLESGHSVQCDTFSNETLSSSPNFDCVGLEIWGF